MLNIEHFKVHLVLVKSHENWIPLESNFKRQLSHSIPLIHINPAAERPPTKIKEPLSNRGPQT